MAEIPFWVHDRPKWVSGITKSTTCQDVLHSLVLAERRANKSSSGDTKKKKEANQDEANVAKEVSRGLALVEQWRGVERPLSNSSRILKLWLAWGEERSQVRFVVKRISTTAANQASVSNTLTRPSRSSRPRRRNSRASVTSDNTKTLHPNVLKGTSSELERLMRIILTQGETIHWQLKKLQDREGLIDSIEQEVHDTRTKTAGKDYLLNAYLSQDSTASKTRKPDLEATAEGLHDILEALGKVFKLNEQLQEAEEKMHDLQSQLQVHNVSQDCKPDVQVELRDLAASNEAAGREIDYNRHLISSMRLAYDEKKALMDKLEADVDTIELEGQRLQQELQALTRTRQDQTFNILSKVPIRDNDDIDLDSDDLDEPIILDGGFLDNLKGHYNILTSEQLYEGPSQEPGALYDELQRRLRIKTSLGDLALTNPDDHSTNRIKATGSPGSNSSSGNSSGSGASYEKSVRFNDRELILSTPDLPSVVSHGPLPLKKPSILKPGEGSGSSPSTNTGPDNTDSNSDTGLSSLHSSSDEGTYVLDTLV